MDGPTLIWELLIKASERSYVPTFHEQTTSDSLVDKNNDNLPRMIVQIRLEVLKQNMYFLDRYLMSKQGSGGVQAVRFRHIDP